jgi:predicted NBD/HSP70 family sugar kinase
VPKPPPSRVTLSDLPLGSRSILREILVRGARSRTDLAKALDLTLPNVTRLTRPLVELGVLIESPVEPVAGLGRPRQPLDVAVADHHVVGVKITADDLHVARTDLRATVTAEVHEPLAATEPGLVAEQIAGIVARLTDEPGVVRGVGVTIGGHAPDRSTVESAPFLGWSDVDFGGLLSERTGLPTVVDNDVAGLAVYLHWFGSARDLDRFAVITVGAGVGFGLVTHNRLVRSRTADLNGLGQHVARTDDDGTVRTVASYLTTTAICEQASRAYGSELDHPQVLALAHDGDPACLRVVDDAAFALGRLVASVADVALVEHVVLSGEGIMLATQRRQTLEAAVRTGRPTADGPLMDVHGVDFTEWARGAAVLAIQEFVAAPATVHPALGG